MAIPHDLEIEIPFDSAILLLGIYQKDYKLFCYEDTCTHMFIVALFTIAKSWNKPKCPSMIDLDKENVAHIHHRILCSHKKRVHVLCRDTDECRNHHSQQTDTRIKKKIPHALTHRWVLNNTLAQGGEHHTQVSLAGGRRETAGSGEGWEGGEG